MDNTVHRSKLLLRSLNLLAILISTSLAFLSLKEWYYVSILHYTGKYPFGSEGPMPYYYRSAEIYSATNLIWGLLFLAVLTFSLFGVKGRKVRAALALGLAMLLLSAMLIQSKTGLY